MAIFTDASHEYWATISGQDLETLLRREELVSTWGVAAVEFRSDLIPPQVYRSLLDRNRWEMPTFVAHFGIGNASRDAAADLCASLASNIHGCICHSRSEALYDIQAATLSANRYFAAAYHSQEPMSYEEALAEFEFQETLNPLFRKIAVRAFTIYDALGILRATIDAKLAGGSPVIGAVFGPQRWARIALAAVGSAVSFVITDKVANEVGGDDEQLKLVEVDGLITSRLMPSK